MNLSRVPGVRVWTLGNLKAGVLVVWVVFVDAGFLTAIFHNAS